MGHSRQDTRNGSALPPLLLQMAMSTPSALASFFEFLEHVPPFWPPTLGNVAVLRTQYVALKCCLHWETTTDSECDQPEKITKFN
jgi:hypothetical protein